MKKILGSSAALFLLTFFFETSMVSCTKDRTIYDTVTVTDTVTVRDTVYADTFITAQMFTAAPWKTQEKRAAYGGDSIYYLRGGSNNVNNYGNIDIEYFKFETNGAGHSIDGVGARHEIYNWQFVDAGHTKVTFDIQAIAGSNSILSHITLENLRYKNGFLYDDMYFLDKYANLYYHGQTVRFQDATQ